MTYADIRTRLASPTTPDGPAYWRSLDDLAGSRDEDVARVAEGIRQRHDKASADSEMLASSLDAQLDDALDRHEIDQQLMERKRRLGLAEG